MAVSGGGDSLGMLAMAAAEMPDRLLILTVDHRLRTGSAADAAYVEAICADRGLACVRLDLQWAEDLPSANRAASARAARYAAMAKVCRERGVPYLLTAHHRDDQAETILMRLARGSGAAGLRGIKARTCIAGLAVLRPVLGETRASLRAAAEAAGFEPREDPTNRDMAYDRPRFRALLQREPLLDPRHLAETAGHLADVEQALCWAEERAVAGNLRREGDVVVLDPAGLPAELVRRLLLRAISMLSSGAAPRGPALARFQSALVEGRTATLGGTRGRVHGSEWHLQAAPPRRSGAST
ncbi:tRNA lysidine(34) synthetase TilS [Pacificimonas flava]|uniref:tRNA(Ile)-lysidine synthase n=1 Tax=Pacificimonas flava TaxID=1234595 RepID=M2SCT2_9SPHN|nr:tRNA lysidine(34) synthetase TilS [Pacificimonas flava]EMD83185.1 tRNA(Ile)-lysidine synthetase [Pacificimonas flava]MBB5279250.1 tRNA(Ile)-lysidine synthase [Pacificimonas flava]